MAKGSSVRLDDHSAELIRLLGDRAWAAFEAIGQAAEKYAKKALTNSAEVGIDLTAYGEKNNSRVDLGRLRNSIAHTVTEAAAHMHEYTDNTGASYSQKIGAAPNDPAVYIGTNVEYAPYHELGTGIYASEPGGRQSPWVYRDRKGNAHRTRGLYPLHFLRNACEMHMDEYKQIIQTIFDRIGG